MYCHSKTIKSSTKQAMFLQCCSKKQCAG